MREPIEYESAEEYDQVMGELARMEREFNEAYPETVSKGIQPQSQEHYLPLNMNMNTNMNMKGTRTMKMSEAFPGRYMRADDCEEEPILTIVDLCFEDVGTKGKKDEKYVLYFKESDKGMVVNKTNWKGISEVLGSDDSDDWIGKRIQLYVGSATFGGEEVDAIRVKKRQNRPAPPARSGSAAGQERRPDPMPIGRSPQATRQPAVSGTVARSAAIQAQAPPDYWEEEPPNDEIPF